MITLNAPFMGETEWDLDGYLVNLKGAALREAAAGLGITVKSRMPVAEIRNAIRAHYSPQGRTMRVMWEKTEWHAVELDGEMHLSRICTGCWATGAGYAGMWSTNRHTVEKVVSKARIAARDENIATLRAAGLDEDADDLDARAWKVL